GFYDRSAEVYRALLQRTPGDRVLEARLREVEQLDHEPAPPESAMTIEFEPLTEPDYQADSGTTPAEDDDAREEWMAGVASGWAEPEPAAPGDDGLYSWQDENFSDSGQGEPTLGDYFRQLLGWQPAAPVAASEPAPDEPEPLLIIDRDETAVSFEGQAEPAPMTVPLMEWEPPFLEEAPEAETPSAPAHAAQAPASNRSFSDNPVDAAFEEWFEGVPAGAPEPVEAAAPASAEYDGVPEPRAEAAETGIAKSPEPSPSLNDESDDDLEMFRSWLQSLKR
ncbi:MAG TPA: hypothetical protein VK864_03180, partial [Longimicrobiales bacterium]|nr:hypothetical protein [Longimicrobiales bacterium]